MAIALFIILPICIAQTGPSVYVVVDNAYNSEITGNLYIYIKGSGDSAEMQDITEECLNKLGIEQGTIKVPAGSGGNPGQLKLNIDSCIAGKNLIKDNIIHHYEYLLGGEKVSEKIGAQTSPETQILGKGAASGGGVSAIIKNIGDRSGVGEVKWSYKRSGEDNSKYIELAMCKTGARVYNSETKTFSSPVMIRADDSKEFLCGRGQDPNFPIPSSSDRGPWIIKIAFLGHAAEIEWGEGIYQDMEDMGNIKSCKEIGGACSTNKLPYTCPAGSYPLLKINSNCCDGEEKEIEGFSCKTASFMNPCCAKLGGGITIDDIYVLYLDVNPYLQEKGDPEEPGLIEICEKDEDCLSFGSGPDNPEIGGCLIGRCDTDKNSPDFGKCYSDYSALCQRNCYGGESLSTFCNGEIPPKCKTPYEDKSVCESCVSGKYRWREYQARMDCCFGILHLIDKSRNWCNSGAVNCDSEGEDYEECLESRKGSCVHGMWYSDHCFDGIQNCDEEGVDCGGADCKPCDEVKVEPEGSGSLLVEVYRYGGVIGSAIPIQYCTDDMGGCKYDSECEKGIYVPYSEVDPACEPAPYSGVGVRLYEVKSEQNIVVLKDIYLRERNDGTVLFEGLEVDKSYQIEVTDWEMPISNSIYWSSGYALRLPIRISEAGEQKMESFYIRYLSGYLACDGEPKGEIKFKPELGVYREWSCQVLNTLNDLPVKIDRYDAPTVPFCDYNPPKVCDLELDLELIQSSPIGRDKTTLMKFIYDPGKASELCRAMHEGEIANYCGKTQSLRSSSELSERASQNSQNLPVGFFVQSGAVSFSGEDRRTGAWTGRWHIGAESSAEGISPGGSKKSDPVNGGGGEEGGGSSKYWWVSSCGNGCSSGGPCEQYLKLRDSANFKLPYTSATKSGVEDNLCKSHFHQDICNGVNRATPDRKPGVFGSDITCEGCVITYLSSEGALKSCSCEKRVGNLEYKCVATTPEVYTQGDYVYTGLRWSILRYSDCAQKPEVMATEQDVCVGDKIKRFSCSDESNRLDSEVVDCSTYISGYVQTGGNYGKPHVCWNNMCLPDCSKCGEGWFETCNEAKCTGGEQCKWWGWGGCETVGGLGHHCKFTKNPLVGGTCEFIG